MRGEELGRVVGLHVGAPEGDHAVGMGVGFIETVAGELDHAGEDAPGDRLVHALRLGPLHEVALVLLELVRPELLAHDLAHDVRFGVAEAAYLREGSHELFLIDHHAEGLGEHTLHDRVIVKDAGFPGLGRRVDRDQVHRPWPIERGGVGDH